MFRSNKKYAHITLFLHNFFKILEPFLFIGRKKYSIILPSTFQDGLLKRIDPGPSLRIFCGYLKLFEKCCHFRASSHCQGQGWLGNTLRPNTSSKPRAANAEALSGDLKGQKYFHKTTQTLSIFFSVLTCCQLPSVGAKSSENSGALA